MSFKRADMYYSDYSWTANANDDDPKVKGFPDSTFLSRMEGWEMLYFTNKLAEEWKWQQPITKQAYQKIERAIREQVPGNIRSREKIQTWIEENLTFLWQHY